MAGLATERPECKRVCKRLGAAVAAAPSARRPRSRHSLAHDRISSITLTLVIATSRAWRHATSKTSGVPFSTSRTAVKRRHEAASGERCVSDSVEDENAGPARETYLREED